VAVSADMQHTYIHIPPIARRVSTLLSRPGHFSGFWWIRPTVMRYLLVMCTFGLQIIIHIRAPFHGSNKTFNWFLFLQKNVGPRLPRILRLTTNPSFFPHYSIHINPDISLPRSTVYYIGMIIIIPTYSMTLVLYQCSTTITMTSNTYMHNRPQRYLMYSLCI
jgi:hypothetical protein